MTKPRSGISALTGLVVVVLILGAALYVGIAAVSSNSITSSTIGGSSGSTTSTTTSPTGSSSSSTGTLTISSSQPLMVAPGTNETVPLKFSAIGTVSGSYALSATSLPKGVSATFSPATLSLPSQLATGATMTLSAAAGATVVNTTIGISATAGSSVFSAQVSLMSVQALVLIQGNAFIPNSLTVASGTKVYWLNLDPSSSPDLGPDMHDVTALDSSFSSGNGNLGQYDIFSHVFSAAGTVKYESQAQPSMTAQITVTG
ncbi:MAG TPA: hypothetical protein VLX56_01530 [Nitrososphaerales archaeon]|nr:hypothetical protein [Nitrososphaerales archaeon]